MQKNDVKTNTGSRVLIYSHDTMGLGHLRRCRAIAHSLVEKFPDLSVLILSGSPIIGSFDFRARVDFVRIPGVIKLRDGEYTTLNLAIDIDETISLRSSIIKHTADIFDPDVFIVDKEPTGLRGEVLETLKMLKSRNKRIVLGLRDILDASAILAPEWKRKNVLPALRELYDEIWIYGLPQIYEPLADLPLPKKVLNKVIYTGYLKRSAQKNNSDELHFFSKNTDYLLVTTGGGGDGEELIEWVLKAYENEPLLPYHALFVLGPFMAPERQDEFKKRCEKIKRVHAITFDTQMEDLEANAAGIVAMGGYNTFCEILSLDKKAIVIPRTTPRFEQYIRASKAEELGLIKMLDDNGQLDANVMTDALRNMPKQKLPSETIVPGLLEGLENVNRLIEPWINLKKTAITSIKKYTTSKT